MVANGVEVGGVIGGDGGAGAAEGLIRRAEVSVPRVVVGERVVGAEEREEVGERLGGAEAGGGAGGRY